MYVYLELPEGRVPDELIVGSKTVIGIALSMKDRAGGKSKSVMLVPEPARGMRSRLYVVNSPLEEIHVDMMKKVQEGLALRSSMATLASVFGFDSDIPSPGNTLGWETLSRKVAARAAQLDSHVLARLEELGLKVSRSRKSKKV
jgi:hypothetical protein